MWPELQASSGGAEPPAGPGPTQLRHLPCSQPGPVEPGGQRHSPVTWWQAAPGGHWQRWAQASPNWPCGQAAGRRGLAWGSPGRRGPGAPRGEGPAPAWAVGPRGAGGAGGSPLSHRRPLHPGVQRQAPVMGWQVAPRRQAQCPSQRSPNVPSGQAAGRDRGKATSLGAGRGPDVPRPTLGDFQARPSRRGPWAAQTAPRPLHVNRPPSEAPTR